MKVTQDLFTENYKTLLRKIQENLILKILKIHL